jgi:hypothetical protein
MDSTLELIIELKNQASAGLAELKQQVGDLGEATNGLAIAGFTLLGEVAYDAAQQMVGAIGGSIQAAGDFEAGINNLAAIAGDSLAQAGFAFSDVEAKALALGSSTAFSASQALAAMTELVKGGVPIADVMAGATDATLTLAAAGGTELATAAEIVAKNLGVWAETGVTAAQVSDLLAQTANASTVGVEDLQLGLSNVAGTAKTAGVDFNELVQTMGLIAPGFSSAADAGTSLKTLISNLQPTTGPAIAAMNELGLMVFDTKRAMDTLRAEGIEPAGTDMQTLSNQLLGVAGSMGMSMSEAAKWIEGFNTSVFYDQTGAFVGMEQAATLLNAATKDLSESEKVMALNTIFGSDAIRAAAAIADAGGEGFNEFGQAMEGAGTAASIAEQQNQGFNFALDSLMGSVETLQIVVGGALLPVLTSLINDLLIPGVNAVTTFSQALMGGADPVTAFSEALASLSTGDALSIFDPAAIATQVTGFVTAIGTTIVAAAPGIFQQATAIGVQVIAAIGAAAPGIIATLGQWVMAFQQWLLEAGPPMLAGLGGIVAQLLAAVGAALPGIVESLAQWGAAMFAWVVDASPQMLGELLNLLGQLIAYIASNAPAIAAQLGTWAIAFLQWVGPAAADLLVALGTMAGQLFGFLAEQVPFIVSTLLEWATAFWQWVGTDAIPGLLSALDGFVSQLFSKLGEAAGQAPGKAAEIGKQIVAGMVRGIQNAASSLWNAVTNLVNNALGEAESAAEISSPSALFARGVGEPITQGIAQGIMDQIPEAASAAAQAAQEALSAAQDELGIRSPSLAFSEGVGSPIVDGMAAGLLGNVGTLLDAAQEIGGTVLQEAQAWADDISAAVAPLIEAGFAGAADFARTQMDAIDNIAELFEEGSATKAIESADKALAKLDEQLAKLKKEAADTSKGGSGSDDKASKLAEKRKKAEDDLTKIAEERARLEITAAQNSDPDKRRAAQAKLTDLAEKERKIRADLAKLDDQDSEGKKGKDTAEKIAELEAERAKVEAERARQLDIQAKQQAIAEQAATAYNEAIAQAERLQDPEESAAFLALRAKQIEERAKLESDLAAAETDSEKERLQNKLRLLDIAHQNEYQLYESQARSRARDRDNALREATLLAEQLGNLVYYSQEDVFGQGQDIILGIAQGMQSQLGALRGTITSVMDEVLAEARRELGIASPSAVAADLIGAPLGQGVAAGLAATKAQIEQAAQDAVSGALIAPPAMTLPAPVLMPVDDPFFEMQTTPRGVPPAIAPTLPPIGPQSTAAASSATVQHYVTIEPGAITIGAGSAITQREVEEAIRRGVKTALDETGRLGDIRQRTRSVR